MSLTTTHFGVTKNIAVNNVSFADGVLTIETELFRYNWDFCLKVGNDEYRRKDMDEEVVEGAEVFDSFGDDYLWYRLYSPKCSGPRPMILFLHGSDECGSDNLAQIAGEFGPMEFARKYPDFYIMAPQALPAAMPPKSDFAHSDQKPEDKSGWCRERLAAVCDVIRNMIKEGKIDPSRVYVTGYSMGGAGTLRAMSVGADLFAAAVSICPSMTPETLGILKGLVHSKIWLATSYIDHTLYRHKYIVDGIMALKDAGNKDAHLTLYSEEDLHAYGIAVDPDLSLADMFAANHSAWVLTYHNEYGIMNWLTEQTK